MADIKLFSLTDGVTELPAASVTLERDLQTLIERNMQTFFGVTFLKSEVPIRDGRMDSLGLDENYSPIIFEYKRSMSENVINQGLFYLDWLLDHKADFKLLVMEALGLGVAEKIDWSVPGVICIANGFTKFDEHAVNLMQRNIKLIKYKKFGDGLLLFEQVNAPAAKPMVAAGTEQASKKSGDKTFDEQLAGTSGELQIIYSSIRDYILSLGDDISENQLKLYCAFKKIKNIICAEIRSRCIVLYLRLDPGSLLREQEMSLVRDVHNIGHWGTGDVELTIRSAKEFESIKYLLDRCYDEN